MLLISRITFRFAPAATAAEGVIKSAEAEFPVVMSSSDHPVCDTEKLSENCAAEDALPTFRLGICASDLASILHSEFAGRTCAESDPPQ